DNDLLMIYSLTPPPAVSALSLILIQIQIILDFSRKRNYTIYVLEKKYTLEDIMAQITDPIAVFDSGMGGISVLKEMVRLMPEEDFIYFGDSLHAPYGTKTTEEVRRLTIERITDFIENKHAKAIAVACNTATSAAVAILRQMYPDVPLVGVEPAIKPAVFACEHPRVLVMATPITLKEEKFHNLEALYDDKAEIYPLPCP